MIVRTVAVLLILGWAVGGLVTLSGLGASLWSIYGEDFWGVVQGIGLVIWGIWTVQLSIFASRSFARTFAPKRNTDSADL